MDTIILDNSTVETVIIKISEFQESSRKWTDITDKPAVIAAGATIQEALEQIGLENVNAEILALQEEQIAQNEDIALRATTEYVNDEIGNLVEYVNQGDQTNASAITAENQRAITAEQNISNNLATETTNRIAGDQTNANAIIAETNRATTAEATKVDKVAGLGLSQENFTTALKNKLDSITAIFTTTLKTAYDSAVTWISTNGANILNHLSSTSNPHSVTKTQVGLGNVPNTDFTATIANKVDKVAGKGLSEEDYTTVEKSKLSGISSGATANQTDAYLLNTDNHTNGTVNKVFTAILLSKLNSITAIFTTALQTAYDSAVTWISTNGANLITHLSRTDNPHSVTKAQVGLGSVDNTPDTAKPLSVLAVASYNAASGVNTPLTNAMSPLQMFQNLQKQSDNRYTKAESNLRYATLPPVGPTLSSILVGDTRGTNPLPYTDRQKGVWFEFKNSADMGLVSGNTYSAVTTFIPWSDNSGNNAAAYRMASSANNLYYQSYSAGAWVTWYRLLDNRGSSANILLGDGTPKPVSDFVLATQKGAANGVATLGADSKIPSSQLPDLAITDTFPVASQAAMLSLTAQVGDIAIRSDISKTFILRVEPATTLANWSELLNPTDAVTSVAGKTGVVTLVKADVGLGSVDNIADAVKEVLSATKLKTARKINGVDFDGTANITVTSPSNLALGTRTDTTQPITNDNGSGFTLPVATTTLAGLLSGTLKTAYDAVVSWVSTNGSNVLSHLSSTSNPHSVTKSQVGLGSVDDTPDTAKPVSTAQQTAIDAKVADNLTASTTVAPSKTAVNTALALKATLASPTFTGTPSLPTGTTAVKQTIGDNTTKIATTSFVAEGLALKAPIRYEAITAIGSNITLALTDENDYLRISGTRNITVPPNSTVAFPIGARIDFIALSSAVATFVQGAGVTITKKTDLILTGFGACTLIKTGTDTWDLIGNN